MRLTHNKISKLRKMKHQTKKFKHNSKQKNKTFSKRPSKHLKHKSIRTNFLIKQKGGDLTNEPESTSDYIPINELLKQIKKNLRIMIFLIYPLNNLNFLSK